jgi:hypothetical protein
MRQAFGALGIYAVASVLLFGRDVVTNPADTVVGDSGPDKTLYMWSFVWWPWAVANGRNPLSTDLAWAPHGIEFGWMNAGAGLAALGAPITSAAGPVVTYNVLILVAPVAAATTAFLLARRVTNAFLPALVTGYAYGFSSYELGHLVGHLPLAFVALVPVAVHLALKRVSNELTRPRFVMLFALVLVGQFLIVPQLVFTLGLLAAAVLTLGALLFRDRQLWRLLGEIAGSSTVAAALVSPFLVHAIAAGGIGDVPKRSPFSDSADVLNFVVPTRLTWVRPPFADDVSTRFTSNAAEQGAYLGLPFLVLFALAVLSRPRRGTRLVLGGAFLVAAVLSLGPRVKFAGTVVGIAPWDGIARLPVLGSALPIRMTLYCTLAAALGVGLALADRGTAFRWALAATGVVMTLPNLSLGLWSSSVPRPAFFDHPAFRTYVRADDTVLVLPYGPAGWSMLWHAESEFSFRLVGGHFALRVTSRERHWRDVYAGLSRGHVPRCRLVAFLAAHRVDAVVVTQGTRGATHRALAAAVDAPPLHSADVVVYRLARPDTAVGTCRTG